MVERDNTSSLVVFSGLYQSLFKQQKMSEAETAFGALIRRAIADNNISVKFLFRVRSQEFRDDGDLAIQYPIWLRQIAKQMYASGKCLEINGHASKSGSPEFNDRLSLQRALWIKTKLIEAEPRLSKRLSANGKGFKENVIGSGTDSALDAIDRRVDFSIVACR
jgi:outer membrane protein OmpA-like peptidoglycan-associated protein